MPFRFWASDSRGSSRTVKGSHQQPECSGPASPDSAGLPTPISPKKRRPSFVDTTDPLAGSAPSKRLKTERYGCLPSPASASADSDGANMLRKSTAPAVDMESAKDVIRYQFGLEILLKHDELRLINQELAKCQIALEQLRRCHLIPYPVQCPTPSQMLDISSGKGPALQPRSGKAVPKWAPPFGVVEGPYARHYAKWLIPDPMFDGIQPQAQGSIDAGRVRSTTAEGRMTRSSVSDMGASVKPRSARGAAGQRLHALSSGYAQPKDRQSPCIVKRSDGLTVKLVCIDCHRWDFSSTQGFINHCRIAHRRDFKSHEEAAVHCGHPIDVDESGAVIGDDNKASSRGTATGLVHPLARPNSITEEEAYKALLSRINTSLGMYKAGKLPNVSSIPGAPAPVRTAAAGAGPARDFVGSSDAPYLSRLMQKKNISGNLKDQVSEAKVKVDWDWLSAGEESDADQPPSKEGTATPDKPAGPAARTPAATRMPARSAVSPPPSTVPQPGRDQSRSTTAAEAVDSESTEPSAIYDEDMDVDMSPNTMTSNNAPSLVSDDGEYDDSDDGSASDTSEGAESESVSDVAEINLDDDGDAQDGAPRPISRRQGAGNNPTKLKKDESKHVTFVAPTPPVPTTAKGRRKQKK
ncbi:hypothetical protein VTK26DRAFT_4712 [Humicola hyalothermophila]